MTIAEVKQLWETGEPIPIYKAPTLMMPLERHALEEGGVIEVHRDSSTNNRMILVFRQDGMADEVRSVKNM